MKWGLLTRVTTWFVINLVALMALITAHFATDIASMKWWADAFAVATNLLAGGLVSFLFYFLVVHVPDRRKKEIVKTNLQQLYHNIKHDILLSVVLASIQGGRQDISTDSETLEKLMTPEGFKEVFAKGRAADEGFYAFENQMSYETWEFRQIVLNLQMLSKQIDYL